MISFSSKFILLTLIVAFASVFFISSSVASAAQIKLNGWGWSSNIGHVSFSSQTDGATEANGANGAEYGVELDDVTGVISGHAWSSSIGWISFNKSDVDVCPTLSEEDGSSKQARVISVTSDGTRQVLGWARALNGDTDTEPGNFQTGDWDGCIHLSSGLSSGGKHNTNVSDGTRGVTLIKKDGKDTFVGLAWGGEVVGWLNFAPFLANEINPTPQNPPGVCVVNCCVGVCGTGTTPTVDVVVNEDTDDDVTVTADSSGLVDVRVVYTATNVFVSQCDTFGSWPGATTRAPGTNISETVALNIGSATTPQFKFFRLKCGGFDDIVNVTVNPANNNIPGNPLDIECFATSDGLNQITEIQAGKPVTWVARVTDGQPIFQFSWSGDGFPSGGTPFESVSSLAPVNISKARVYTTTGTKVVNISVSDASNPLRIGTCGINGTFVQVIAKPVIQPF